MPTCTQPMPNSARLVHTYASAGFMHHLTLPWGELQRLPTGSGLSQRCVCTSPSSKSSNILLCQASSAVCKEGKSELVRATPQVTALTSDTASSQETQRSDLAMLSLGHLSSWILSPVPCLTFLKSVVHNWAKPLKY